MAYDENYNPCEDALRENYERKIIELEKQISEMRTINKKLESTIINLTKGDEDEEI